MNSWLHDSGYLKLFEYSRKGTLKSIPKLLVLKKGNKRTVGNIKCLRELSFLDNV